MARRADWQNLSDFPELQAFVQRMFRETLPRGMKITGYYNEERPERGSRKCFRPHWGVDVSPAKRQEIIAPFAGRVVEVIETNARGVYKGKVSIVDDFGRFIVFRHLDPITVSVGQVVAVGECIGGTTQNHIHFEVGWVEDDNTAHWRDPLEWVSISDALGYTVRPEEIQNEWPGLDHLQPPSLPRWCLPAPPPTWRQLPYRHDSLVINLYGQGTRTLGVEAGIYFDHDANGFKEATGWIAPGNGLLMLDRNGSASLDTGGELFGDFTPLPNGMLAANGFQALACYDANGDGRIDVDDPIWSQLGGWQYDTYSEGGEAYDPDTSGKISSLDELGIAEIHLDTTITNITDDVGNRGVRRGYFEWSDGRVSTVAGWGKQERVWTKVHTSLESQRCSHGRADAAAGSVDLIRRYSIENFTDSDVPMLYVNHEASVYGPPVMVADGRKLLTTSLQNLCRTKERASSRVSRPLPLSLFPTPSVQRPQEIILRHPAPPYLRRERVPRK